MALFAKDARDVKHQVGAFPVPVHAAAQLIVICVAVLVIEPEGHELEARLGRKVLSQKVAPAIKAVCHLAKDLFAFRVTQKDDAAQLLVVGPRFGILTVRGTLFLAAFFLGLFGFLALFASGAGRRGSDVGRG